MSESFNVRFDYKELDLTAGTTTDRTFFCTVLATDAAAALGFALAELKRPPRPDTKIWGLSALVEVTSDVLRDKLRDTEQPVVSGE